MLCPLILSCVPSVPKPIYIEMPYPSSMTRVSLRSQLLSPLLLWKYRTSPPLSPPQDPLMQWLSVLHPLLPAQFSPYRDDMVFGISGSVQLYRPCCHAEASRDSGRLQRSQQTSLRLRSLWRTTAKDNKNRASFCRGLQGV